MVDNQNQCVVVADGAFDKQYVASEEVACAVADKDVLGQERVEEFFAEKQGVVDATAVGRVEMDEIVVAVAQYCSAAEVAQNFVVLDFGQSYGERRMHYVSGLFAEA